MNKKATVIIQIHYRSIDTDSKVLQQGEFQLRGKKPEQVALQFWIRIKREMQIGVELQKVICEGEDITKKVKELEKFQ